MSAGVKNQKPVPVIFRNMENRQIYQFNAFLSTTELIFENICVFLQMKKIIMTANNQNTEMVISL